MALSFGDEEGGRQADRLCVRGVGDETLGEELLESTDLAALAGASPVALSGGEQRRLAVAAAIELGHAFG